MRRHLAPLLLLAACFGRDPAPPAEPAPPPAEPAAASLPDVVVITLDTTRADHLGTYGYFRDTSPHLDALARESLVFERLVVPMATTLPTHTSLFTGTWPTEHGILANVQHGGRKFVPSDGLVPLASWLADEGYHTAAFVSAAPLNRTSGLARGFHTYDTPQGVERQADATTDAALGWLAEAPASPMLLWVHYFDPHNPYRAPEAHLQHIKQARDRDRMDAWMEERVVAPVARRPTGQRVVARPTLDLYDAEIHFMDAHLARLLEGLERRGRGDNTLLVVMGDHGESLNQHEEPGHGLVWGEQLHAPLFVKAPGVTPARIPTLLSAADVLPTALGLVDLPGEERFLAQASGVDVLAEGFVERPVLSQTSERQLSFGKPMTYALTGPRWKCRWAEGEPPLLWDVVADPHELAPVDDPATLEGCVATLRHTLAAQQARAATLGSGATTEVDDDELRALEALGYFDNAPRAEPADRAAPRPERTDR